MDNKKKIIINATCVGENPTGVGIFTTELVSNLVSMRPDLFYVYGSYDFISHFENKKIVSKYLSPEYGPRGHISRILWTQTLLALEYKKMGGSMLLSTLPEAPVIIRNKIVVVHDIIPAKFPEVQPRMKYNFLYVVPWILRTARYLVFDSDHTRNDVFDFYGLKGIPNSVVQLGYNKDLFRPLEKGLIKKKYGYDRYFFYVGDMRPYKNLKNAIISFAKAGLDDVLFVIAGKQDMRYFPDIKKIVDDLNLGERVIFADYVPIEDLPHFYSDAIALFFPSKYEGFGLPPLESMATGTPVITTRMASIPEVCGDAAVYVDPDNIEEMAEALKRLAKDAALRDSLAHESLKRASLFSWEKAAKEYMDLFLEVLDEA